jgi:signal transduction histidine kinase
MPASMKTEFPTWSFRHAERAAAAHALGAKLAHDLGTPLNVILGRASLIADDPEAAPEVQNHADVIAKQARALHELINGFIGAVRRPYEGTTGSHLPLAPILEAAAREAAPLAAERGVSIEVAAASGSARLEPLLAVHAVSAVLAHAVALADGSVTLTADVAEVARPQARRCAPGLYGRFIIEARPVAGSDAANDPTLALAAAEGALRVLGGYLAVESPSDRVRYEACVPTR